MRGQQRILALLLVAFESVVHANGNMCTPRVHPDVNCNGIPRDQESADCVQYSEYNSCDATELVNRTYCDDYVADCGVEGQCSSNLAPDSDYLGCPDGKSPCPDLVGDDCDNCPDWYNPDQLDSVGDGKKGDACRCDGVICPPPPDQCHRAGTCEPTTGKCVYPLAPADTPCSLRNAQAACDSSGKCTQVITCADGYADCNNDPSDGCETDTKTPENCGRCGVVCDAVGGQGGCSVILTPGNRSFADVAVLAVLLLCMVRRRRNAFLFVALLALDPPTYGESSHGTATKIDVDVFQPAVGPRYFLVIPTVEMPAGVQISADALFHYADEPLRLTMNGDTRAALVQHRMTTDFAIGVAFLGRYQVSIQLPVTVYQRGDDPVHMDLAPQHQQGVEDLRIAFKVRFVGNESCGFGGLVELVAPTAPPDSYLESRNVTGAAQLLFHAASERFRLSLMAGWRFAFEEEQFFSLRSGNSALFGAGVSVLLSQDDFRRSEWWLSVEAYGRFHYLFENQQNMPGEVAASANYHLGKNLVMYLLAATGVDNGLGEPHIRLGLGLTGAVDWDVASNSRPKRHKSSDSASSSYNEVADAAPPPVDPLPRPSVITVSSAMPIPVSSSSRALVVPSRPIADGTPTGQTTGQNQQLPHPQLSSHTTDQPSADDLAEYSQLRYKTVDMDGSGLDTVEKYLQFRRQFATHEEAALALAEYGLLRHKAVDVHGNSLDTIEKYLKARRQFATDKEWAEQAKEADSEFANNAKLLRREMPLGKDEYLRELYHWVRNAYIRNGITNPIEVMRSGEAPELHDAIAKVEETEGKLRRGGFSARPEKSAKANSRFLLGTLSEHATGRATDIDDRHNAFLSKEQWSYILEVTGMRVDRSHEQWLKHPAELWQKVHDISEAFAKLDHEKEIKKLKEKKAGSNLIALHEEWADGFFVMPKSTVVALHDNGFVWGITFPSNVDLHHYEIRPEKKKK